MPYIGPLKELKTASTSAFWWQAAEVGITPIAVAAVSATPGTASPRSRLRDGRGRSKPCPDAGLTRRSAVLFNEGPDAYVVRSWACFGDVDRR